MDRSRCDRHACHLAKPSAAGIREELIDLVRRDLEGPAGGPEEQIDPARFPMVHERYVVGTLAPRGLDLADLVLDMKALDPTHAFERDLLAKSRVVDERQPHRAYHATWTRRGARRRSLHRRDALAPPTQVDVLGYLG